MQVPRPTPLFDFTDRFIELAADVNVGMPRHVVDLAAEALNDRARSLKGARVGVLGVAFKPDVGDAREAPAAHVLAGLRERGAEVRFHDPHIDRFRDASGRYADLRSFFLAWRDISPDQLAAAARAFLDRVLAGIDALYGDSHVLHDVPLREAAKGRVISMRTLISSWTTTRHTA